MRRFLVLAASFLLACGSGSSSPGEPGSDAWVDGRADADVAPDLPIVFKDTAESADFASDHGPLDGTEGEDVVDALTPCQDGAECPSGFCVVGLDEQKVCAPPCLEAACPAGWKCANVRGTGGDTLFVCLPSAEYLCRPCIDGEDCMPAGVKTRDRCLDFGPEGRFCGRDCSETGECPEGYECKDQGDDGAGAFQCVPSSGECPCPEEFVNGGYETVCFVENEFGRCDGTRRCGPEGLLPCSAATPAAETCDGSDEDCDGQTDDGIQAGECTKTYGEFTCKGPLVCEGGAEVCKAREPTDEDCDGTDDDCDGDTDEEGAAGCVKYYIDADDDSYGTDASWKCLCAAAAPYSTPVKGDCMDEDPAVNPGAPEVCAGGKDDDCDGFTDEEGAGGCADWYRDLDGDGFGGVLDKKCLCAPAGEFTIATGGDCDDGETAVNPDARESCNGRDDDCNGTTDDEDAEGCSEYLADADADGFGADGETRCFCGPTPPWTALKGGDCDDTFAGANPGTAESCDLIDDDCDGDTDEEDASGCETYYEDMDSDGYGPPGASPHCLCAPVPPVSATTLGDCDDGWDGANPGETEKCANLADDDCDGTVDEEGGAECATFYRDDDGDGYGQTGDSKCYCNPVAPYTAVKAGDCDDGWAAIHPGAEEACGNVLDDDCDGQVDEEGGTGCGTYFRDADGDLAGATGDSKCLCAPAGVYTALVDGDCDDGDAQARPGLTEGCDGKDNDCDGAADEEGATGCAPHYVDQDGDTWGVTASSKCLCAPGAQHTATRGGDCADQDPAVNPGATEACDGHDDDCDGGVDERDATGCEPYYRNGDHDGYGVTEDSQCLCAPAPPYDVKQGGDCNDADAETWPGATERCDGHDDDCDAVVDEEDAAGCLTYYWDGDADGWGVDGQTRCLCQPDGKHSATRGQDCADADPTVNPGLAEKCGNQKDDNCDAKVDNEGATGCQPYFEDQDNDGWGTTLSKCLCQPADPYDATKSGDCRDGDAQVYPGRAEACGNGKDDDCDGSENDEGANGCQTFWYDGDADGFGQDGNTKCLCFGANGYTAGKGGDCLEGDGQVYPGRKEVCNNGKDDNCDGQQNEKDATSCTPYWLDNDGDGWGTSQSECWCSPHDNYSATKSGDCDDWNGSVSPGATESCNGVDDNCKNGTDEPGATGCTAFYRDGDNDGYGAGSSQCLCSAQDPFDVTNAADCNDGDPSVWPGASEQCNQRDDDCDSSIDEGFECKVGQTASQSCGRCGTQTRSCTGGCYWGNWSSCSGEGVCTPGEQQTESCGYCGKRTRTCTQYCQWGAWSGCTGEGVCQAGTTEYGSCGNCGTKSRQCQYNCQWGAWGSCYGEGVCSPGSQRNCSNACGKETCTSNCQWGSCVYTKDGYEPDDTWNDANYMGAYTEPNAPGARSAWLHTSSDVDRFYWRGTESSSSFDLSLSASATITTSSSLWHQVCVYWDDGYNGSTEKQKCQSGWGSFTVTLDGLDSWGSTQVGDIDVAVSGDWSCSAYTLQFTWD